MSDDEDRWDRLVDTDPLQLRDEARRMEAEVALLDAALTAIVVCESLDMARGIAHAGLNREQYRPEEFPA